MTQATSSLTSTTASLLTANANTTLKWSLPNWSVASTSSSGSSSFSQMLTSASRSTAASTDQPALENSDSRRRLSRSQRSELGQSEDRRSEASVAENRRSSSERRETALTASRQRNRQRTSDDPSVEPEQNPSLNQDVSDTSVTDSVTQTAEQPQDSSSSSPVASDDSSTDSSTTSPDDQATGADPSDTDDQTASTDQARVARWIGQAAIQPMMPTAMLERLMSSASASAQTTVSQTAVQVTSGTGESKTASGAASDSSSAKATSNILPPLMQATDESSNGQTNGSTNGHSSGLPLTQTETPVTDSGAKSGAKTEIKADFAQKLSEHRPIESLLSMTSEKKSATLLTDSASTSQASNGSASSLQESADQSNIAQVARGLQNAFKQGGGSVTLRLTPAELGSVRVQLDVQDGVVQAKFTAESQAAGDLLTHQMDQLRQALQKQGLQVDRLEVQIPASSTTQASNLSERSSPDSQNPTAWADEGRSRGQMQDSSGQQQRQDRSNPAEPATSFSDLLNTTA